MTPQEIWERHQHEAEWEGYDRIDDYCLACNIHLEVDGYVFEGDGMITYPDDKEILELSCTTPEGETISII